MAMVVKNNMSAVRTLNTLNGNSSALQKSLAKVSSGMKINSAQDDASGYAISERMRVQIRSLDQANQNTQNASSLMKTAEGAVSSTVEILKSLKEKAINAATDTNTDSDRATIQKEIDQFIDQIDDNALTTFNGKYLVDGSKSQKGIATYTAMTNQSLSTDTKPDTDLTALANRNNESLEIKDTDKVTVSYVQDGKTYTTTFAAKGETLQGIFQHAEDIDETSNTFAAANNPSLMAADSDTFTAAKAAAVDTAKATLDAAKQTYADYQTGTTRQGLQNAVDTTKAALDAKASVSGKTAAYQAIGTFADGTALNAVGAGAVKDVLTAALAVYDDADTGATNAPGLGTNKGQANSKTYTSGATGDEAQTIANATSLYNDAKASTSYSGTTTADKAFKTAVDALKTQLDAYAADTAPDTSAEQTAYDNAVTALKNADDAAELAMTNAQKAYNAAAGPAILKSENIGLAASSDMVKTGDGTEGLTITAASDSIKGQISGLTISITDSEGNVKKSANAALDAFKTTIYAKNESEANEMTFQVGAAANQAITVGLDDMRSEALGLKGSDGSKVSVATQDKANAAVSVFDNAIQKVLDQQATIGAIEARLEYTSNNLTTSSENVQAAESTIRDADMAKEMTNYTKNNVLLQAAQSMLAQANQNSSAVLSLLQ